MTSRASKPSNANYNVRSKSQRPANHAGKMLLSFAHDSNFELEPTANMHNMCSEHSDTFGQCVKIRCSSLPCNYHKLWTNPPLAPGFLPICASPPFPEQYQYHAQTTRWDLQSGQEVHAIYARQQLYRRISQRSFLLGPIGQFGPPMISTN